MPPPDACPSCGTTVEPGQEYCLACGARNTPVRRLSAFGDAWERRLGRYPGDWAIAAALLLLVAAGSATAGIVTSGDNGERGGARTIVATSPVVAAPPALPAETQPTTTVEPAPRPRPAPESTLKPPAPELAVWPPHDGYTVVLASIPARGKGLATALSRAHEADSRKVQGVGILLSGGFSSLHPGYYIVFAGVYDTLEQAQTAAHALRSKYPNAYARLVTH